MDNFIPLVLPLGGVGFATDLPAQVRELSHYITLENVIFEQSGALRKVGGNTRINSTAITGTPTITGCFDFWRAGGATTFSQDFVVMTSDSKIYKEDAVDGTFDDVTGAATITANAIPVFAQARDLLLIFDDQRDTPLKFNQTGNVASLGGTPPVGKGAVFHANRAWVWGVAATPSRLYYSSSTDVEDWSGADTGSIDFDPEDGDWIVGAASYKKKLVIFKGPNKGSIHTLSGTAPTGADAFARNVLVRSVPLQTHNSIVPVLDDVWFASDRGIHSLAATEQYGDYQGAFLTRFLQTFYRDSVSRSRHANVWSCNYVEKGSALWVYSANGSSTNNRTLGISYARIQEDGLKPFIWTRGGASCAIRINAGVREVVFGGNADGFVTREDMTSRSISNGATAYALRAKTPKILFAEKHPDGSVVPYRTGTVQGVALNSNSTGDWDIELTLTRDNGGGELYKFNQGNDITTTGGFLLGTSILDLDTLGGGGTTGEPQIVFNEADAATTVYGGEARTIQLDFTQGGLNQDAHLMETTVFWQPGAYSLATDIESNT